MPKAFGTWDQGVHDLKRTIEITVQPSDQIPAAIGSIYRLNACYVLGMALAETDRDEACTLLNTVIMLDPACTYSERAYKRVSELMIEGADTDNSTEASGG